jgi:glycosyltransferase involved in cell wall biosynthesis
MILFIERASMRTKKYRLLIVGPFSKTGGVASHTKALVDQFNNDENIELQSFDTSPESKIKTVQNVKKYLTRKPLLKLFLKKHKDKFDIIHSQTSGGMPSFWSALSIAAVKEEINKKFIMTFHHGDIAELISENKQSFAKVLKVLDHLILVSNMQKQVVVKEFPSFKKITVIPNGFDSEIFLPKDHTKFRDQLKFEKGTQIILNVGNLQKVKGQEYLIKAMKIILKKNKKVKLFIIGNGPYKKTLKDTISNHNLDKYIEMIPGNLSKEEISKWMNICDVFVLPSIRESFGIVQLEALACGKPIISTYNGGSEDIIIDEKLGILVEPKKSELLAKAIEHALDINWDTHHILKYVKRFEWKNIKKKNLEIYDGILANI